MTPTCRLSRSLLLSAVNGAAGIVQTKAAMPVLACVLLEAHDSRLTVTANNLSSSLRVVVPAETSGNFSVCVAAHRLVSILGDLEEDPNGVSLSLSHLCGGAGAALEVRAGRSDYRILFIAGTEFPATVEPALPTVAFEMNAAELAFALSSVGYAMSKDESRAILRNTHISLAGGRGVFTATDGRRLARRSVPIPGATKGMLLLPDSAAASLVKLLGQAFGLVRVAATDRLARFTFVPDTDTKVQKPGFVFTTQLADGKFPEVDAVVPKLKPGEFAAFTAEADTFAAAIERTALVCSEKANSVTLQTSANSVSLAASSPDFGSAEESFESAVNGPAEIRASFNHLFLGQAVAFSKSDKVEVKLGSLASPALVEAEGYLAMVMPVRLS